MPRISEAHHTWLQQFFKNATSRKFVALGQHSRSNTTRKILAASPLFLGAAFNNMSDSDEETEVKCSSKSPPSPQFPSSRNTESPLPFRPRRKSSPSSRHSPPSPLKGYLGRSTPTPTAESEADVSSTNDYSFPRLGLATIGLLSLRAWEWTKLDSVKGPPPKGKKEPPTNTEKLFSDLRAILLDSSSSEDRHDTPENDEDYLHSELLDVLEEAKTPIEDLSSSSSTNSIQNSEVTPVHEGYEKLKELRKVQTLPLNVDYELSSPDSEDDKTVDSAVLKRYEKCFEVFHSKLDSSGRLVLRAPDMAESGRWKALGYFLASRPHIRGLRLQGMEISKNEATQLGKGALKHLRHITFCENNLGLHKEAMEIIVGMLLICDYLESAAINRNNLTDVHIAPLLRLIESHSTLTKLSLSWNAIGDEGAVSLAQQLRNLSESSRLRELDVSCNFIGTRGVKSLRDSTDFIRFKGLPFEVNYRHNSCKSSPYSYPRRPSVGGLPGVSNPVRKLFKWGNSSSRATSNPIAIPRTPAQPISAPSSLCTGTTPPLRPMSFHSWRTPRRTGGTPPDLFPPPLSLYQPAESPDIFLPESSR